MNVNNPVNTIEQCEALATQILETVYKKYTQFRSYVPSSHPTFNIYVSEDLYYKLTRIQNHYKYQISPTYMNNNTPFTIAGHPVYVLRSANNHWSVNYTQESETLFLKYLTR